MVSFMAREWLLDYKASIVRAIRAAGAVTWVLTLSPSLIEEEGFFYSNPIYFPPSINLNNLGSNSKSIILGS
jgi:hypothetical protein